MVMRATPETTTHDPRPPYGLLTDEVTYQSQFKAQDMQQISQSPEENQEQSASEIKICTDPLQYLHQWHTLNHIEALQVCR